MVELKKYDKVYEYMKKNKVHVKSQKMRTEGVLVIFSDGKQDTFEYVLDDDGNECIDMCPNWTIDEGRG